jgi:hypothetical protein
VYEESLKKPESAGISVSPCREDISNVVVDLGQPDGRSLVGQPDGCSLVDQPESLSRSWCPVEKMHFSG